MSQLWKYNFRLHHCRRWLFVFLCFLYNLIAMQIKLNIWLQSKNNMWKDCKIWQPICNVLISYVHLGSEHRRMWLLNFVHTSKNVIMKIHMKLWREYVYTWIESHTVSFLMIFWGSIKNLSRWYRKSIRFLLYIIYTVYI